MKKTLICLSCLVFGGWLLGSMMPEPVTPMNTFKGAIAIFAIVTGAYWIR